MSEILLELPDNHSPHAYQLLQEYPHFAAFLLDPCDRPSRCHETYKIVPSLLHPNQQCPKPPNLRQTQRDAFIRSAQEHLFDDSCDVAGDQVAN
jgi:hypothetical protein